MSLSLSRDSVSQKRTLASLLAGRATKKPKTEDAKMLQEAAMQLLHQHQNLSGLISEVISPSPSEVTIADVLSPDIAGSLLVTELKRQAALLGVPVVALSVKAILEMLMKITCGDDDDGKNEGKGAKRVLLTPCQRVQLCCLLRTARELLSLGAFCPMLFWQEYAKHQKPHKLEVAHHLYTHNILNVKCILESDEGAQAWLVYELQALCGWTSPPEEQEGIEVRHTVLSTVVGVLVGTGYEENLGPPVPDRNTSVICCSVLDHMLSWLLDILEKLHSPPCDAAAEQWIQQLDTSLCGASVSPEALQRFFMHTLTHTLTYKPHLKVSEAIAKQNKWGFAQTSRLLTVLFRKLAVVFSVEELLHRLQQVLETREVNWQHVLSFLSTLLVSNPDTQPSLRGLLSRLLSAAFAGYDLEKIITAFLLARQGALEGPTFFPSYSEWFKLSFGGPSGYHGRSKKSLVFLLKFLSDLVPFDPPQYLKVHILHPPHVAVKHRSLLQEYVSLAKTRLADLKVSVEDMGLYEDVSGAAGEPVKRQVIMDVEKAVSLFESTRKISATVMEASIFRRPYFLSRFLPALLTARALPLKADVKMSFIEALRRADKIPAGQYSSYVEACQRERQQNKKGAHIENDGDDPLEVLNVQLMEFTRIVAEGEDGELLVQLSRMSHTLSLVFPDQAGKPTGPRVIVLHTDTRPSCELRLKVVDRILRTFCQCLLDASRTSPPNKQSQWAAQFVSVLHGQTQLFSALMHRLWDLFHNQGSSLTASQLLGLAALVVHLHASSSQSPVVQMTPSATFEPVSPTQALSAALPCTTRASMLFSVRICVAAACYGLCRSNSLPHQEQQDYIPTGLVKKLVYLIPRLLPEARRAPLTPACLDACGMRPEVDERPEIDPELWGSAVDAGTTTWMKSGRRLWRDTAFRQLAQLPQYQFSFSEWLVNELNVQRSEDILPDAERQEYQQWACLEYYLSCPVEQGGCGGDMRTLCTHMFNSIMDQQAGSLQVSLSNSSQGSSGQGPPTGSCLPDILSRLQELIYEMQQTSLRGRGEACHFLLELLSQRCSSAVTSDSQSISSELSLQQTLQAWNRVLLAFPADLFVTVRNTGGRLTLDFRSLIDHVNQHQRKTRSSVALLPYHITSHVLRGMLSASAHSDCSSAEVNRAWSQISLHCPLLLLSTVHWWDRLSPMLASVWRRLRDDDDLRPELLKSIPDCLHWAHSSQQAAASPVTSAPALLLAACLHRAWGGRGGGLQGRSQAFRGTLEKLSEGKDRHCTQVLVFLLYLCVTNLLSTILYPEEGSRLGTRQMCTDILNVLVDIPDWHLIFKSQQAERGCYQSVAMATLDEYARLRSLSFYSLLLEQCPELLKKAIRCPGFLHTAVLCYASLLQLFLDGHTPNPITFPHVNQMEPSQILGRARQFLLRTISQTSPAALSSSQLSQLESLCAELDPEVAAALSSHLGPHSMSQEMDFL